jgi:PEP-CTERM motif-containing protein
MRKFIAGCVLLGAASIASAATTYTWNFSGGNVDFGNTQAFTSSPGSISITASGFTSNGVPGHLYGKNLGGDELGIGMVADPTGDHEIYFGTDFLQLDLQNVLAAGLTGLQFGMNSSTGGETWAVYKTSSAGTLSGAISIATGSNEAFHSISTSLRYLDFVVTGPGGCGNYCNNNDTPIGNALLYQFTGTTNTPEPSSVGMALLGLGAVGARLITSKL